MTLGLALGAGRAAAQDVGAGAQSGSAEDLPGATRVVRAPEGPVDGLVRRDADTVALTLGGEGWGE